MPMPPFPDPDDALLRVIIESTWEHYTSGALDVRGAILHAAVHGWLEGHLQGEECEQGCTSDRRWIDIPGSPERN